MMEDRVSRGVEKLNEHFGSDEWRERIDVYTLDMFNVRKCVLGQVFGSFYLGVRTLGIEDADWYGFDLSCEEYFDGTDMWRELAFEWDEVLGWISD